MNNLVLVLIIGGSLLCALVGGALIDAASAPETINLGWDLFDYGLRIGGLAGLFLLVKNGTFQKTKYFKIAQVISAVVIIGALFKIQHWPFANGIVIIGLTGIAITYFVSFLKKPVKQRLDYLKITWVILNNALAVLTFLHLIKDDYAVMGNALLWGIIIDFVFTSWRNGTLFAKKAAVEAYDQYDIAKQSQMSPTEKVMDSVNRMIDKEKKNTFINHLLSFNSGTYGETTPTSFTIWEMNRWTGSFYYVIYGTVTEGEGKAKVMLKTKLNPFGRLLAWVIWGTTAYFVITGIVNHYHHSMKFLWVQILIISVLLSTPVLLFRYVYGFEKREQLKKLTAALTSEPS